MIAKFEIPPDGGDAGDLAQRLASTRWADAVTSDWSYGMQESFLRDLARYWEHDYDWRARRAALNELPHFRAAIDGYGLHYLHYRSPGSTGRPLLLMNGWPSSFIEYQRLAPLLTTGDPAFDVVVPTHPGFGYSARPTRPYQVEPADLYPKLMTALGYETFVVAGTDIGSGVATRIALRHPERVLAVHVSAIAARASPKDAPPLSPAEVAYRARLEAWDKEEGGYQAIQSSRPQTLAFGLADSPVGLASWIVEKFRNWSDCNGDVLSVFSREYLVDNLMIYWTTNTIASSVRYYYEASRLRPPLPPTAFVEAPTAIAMWPHDLALAPREAAARLYNVQRYTILPHGGHFPAWEAPNAYAEDLRRLARDVLG